MKKMVERPFDSLLFEDRKRLGGLSPLALALCSRESMEKYNHALSKRVQEEPEYRVNRKEDKSPCFPVRRWDLMAYLDPAEQQSE